ncbi:MAG: protoglobin family protein [Gemmataceae bacterium]
MQAIDEARLETDLDYRYKYLAQFIGFTPDDVSAIQMAAPYLGPQIGELVERTYQRLLSNNATARHFIVRQHGFEGQTPSSIEDLTAAHPQIQFRKDHLSRYLMQLMGRSYDAKMVMYLDMVGKMHTPKAGNPQINIPLVQMNAFMGFFADLLVEVIGTLPLDSATQMKTIRAYCKLLWIQNDLITRHYEGKAG